MAPTLRERVLGEARGLLAGGERPTVAQIAQAAGISKASFYRTFASREQLLDALELAPEPGARERILDAALELVGRQGLATLSMDDLAERSGVSRATLYRLFPGKPALFTALVSTYSPLEPVIELLRTRQDQPPEVVMPAVARTVFRTICGHGADRTGFLRALFFEVSSLAPDTEEAAREAIGKVVGALLGYVVTQMSEGRLQRAHPMVALQSFMGPIFFHVLTRAAAQRVLGVEMEGEATVTELADVWLRGMKP